MLRILVIEGPNAGKSHTVEHGDIVGTTETARIKLGGQGVLPRHLMIRNHVDGWRLYCLDPSEPVHINDEPMTAPKTLTHGDLIQVGETRLLVSEEPEAQPEAAQVDDRGSTTIRARQQFYESSDDVLKTFTSFKNPMSVWV